MDGTVLLSPTYLSSKYRVASFYFMILIACTECQAKAKHGVENYFLNRFDQYLDRAAPYRTSPKQKIQNCTCGQINIPKQQARIINGNEVNPPYKYPWMAVLKKNGRFICAGSLINDRFILTAAHCVVERVYRLYEVVVGVHNIENIRNSNPESVPGEPFIQKSQVERIKFFESNNEYNGQLIENDIALVKLTTPVTFTKQVTPVCLPPNEKIYAQPVRAGIITGWGTTEVAYKSDVLREAIVQVIGHPQCRNQSMAQYGYLSITRICAAGPTKDICQGDGGGPLIIKTATSYTLLGIAPWKNVCARNEYPGIFTSVGSFTNEIYTKTRGGAYCRNIDAGF